MSWLKKLLLMRSSLRLPSGTGGGTLLGNALAAQLLAACLLLTLSSPSLKDEGRKQVSGNDAAPGGAFQWVGAGRISNRVTENLARVLRKELGRMGWVVGIGPQSVVTNVVTTLFELA